MKATRVFPVRASLLVAATCVRLLGADTTKPPTWTNPDGKTIEAEFVGMTDQDVTLKVAGQTNEVKIPHEKLSAESLEQARRLDREAREKALATRGKFKLGDHLIEPGRRADVILPIKGEGTVKLLSELYGKPTKNIKVAVVVPKTFDPADPDSLVVVCHSSTSGGKGLSASMVKTFEKTALASNALVLAADGEFGNPGKNDTPVFRTFLFYSLLETLREDHPSAKWRYINAGHSGGCGYASYNSVYMVSIGMRVAGVFLSGGNYSPLKYDGDYRIKTADKKRIRIYYSFGENDPICTPEHQQVTLDEMKHSAYKNLRVKFHQAKHDMWQPHFEEAMEWFKEPLAD